MLWLVGVGQLLTDDGAMTTRKVVVCAAIIGHLIAAAWFVGFRVVGAAVLAGPDDVIIRNQLSSHRLRWEEIERFTVEPLGPWTAGYVKTVDGESIRIFGIQGQSRTLFPDSTWAEKPIGALNELLEQHRGREASN
jgi:hypothetical protein